MFKFWKKFGHSSNASSAASFHGSMAELTDRFYLEKHGIHGFPLHPSCMAYDKYRHVIFVGTNNGELTMYGKPGVVLTSMHMDNYKVLQILPFCNKPALITVCSNNILNKWEIEEDEGRSQLVLKRTYKFQGGLAKTITYCCLSPFDECLFVGTLGGITYPIDTEFDGMSPEVLSWSRARAYLGYKGKDVPGEVRALQINPVHPRQLLIAYEHSYLEIWDAMTWKPHSLYGPYKKASGIRSLSWGVSGEQFMTAHNDGGLFIWTVNKSEGPTAIKTFYDSSNLQNIIKVLWPEDDFIVFAGGAPHDLIDGDSISICDGKDVTTLQLTSPVKSLYIMEDCQSDMDSGIVGASYDMDTTSTVRKILIMLLEQEILFMELRLPELPLLQPPYMCSIHNSPVKEVLVYSDVDKDVWSIMQRFGKVQQENVYRARCKVWPIDGGMLLNQHHDNRSLLLSGHEDGSVKFWDVSSISMKLLYHVNCSQYFSSASETELSRTESLDEQIKQVRQIGFWDPRSDDDQLIVTCMKFYGEHLLVGFQGGHALMFNINNQTADITIILLRVSIMRDDPRQKVRGWQAPLEVRTDVIECSPGFQASHCIHFFPSVSITSFALAKEQGMLAVGCVYGFAVVDFIKNETIYVHCTFDQDMEDLSNMSRMQSIRRSFRQSLQRVNIRRSMRGMQSVNRSVRPQSTLIRSGSARAGTFNRVSSIRRTSTTNTASTPAKGAAPVAAAAQQTQTPPVIRRDTIRTLTFTAPTHISGSSSVLGLLVGTNQGAVMGYTIDMPAVRQRRTKSPVIMPVEKDFNQRKNQGAVFVGVIDGANYLLDINDEWAFKPKGKHYIIMCIEDIIQVSVIPGMKKKYRVKIKHHDADELRIISAHYIREAGQSSLLAMDSDGNISIYSLPELKLLYKENCVDAADAVGQRHFICSTNGTALFKKSPSEFYRASVTETARLDTNFTLPAKDSSQPTPVRFSRPLSDGPHLVEVDQNGIEQEQDVFEDQLGPVDSKTSVESHKSATSRQSQKSITSQKSVESRKSTSDLPDYYYNQRAPVLQNNFDERAL